MPPDCDCARDQLCDACVDRHVLWHSGMAMLRGERWATSIAARRPELLEEPWPALATGGRALEIAVRKLSDLTDDVRVLAALLVQLQDGAVRTWAKLAARRHEN